MFLNREGVGDTNPLSGDAVNGACAVTGATGYVGSRIANCLAGEGWEIRELGRSAQGAERPQFTSARFDLATGVERGALKGVGALVHAAYDFRAAGWREIERVNVEGSRRLLLAAREARVERLVVVSTLAAFPGARSMYGRAKLEVERIALDFGAAVVRPGLVWGPQGAAMFGAVQRAVQRSPVVPLVGPPDLEVAMVHERDLALLVGRLLESWPQGSGKLFVAAAEPAIAFAEVLRSLALQVGRRPRFVRLPAAAVWLGLRAVEAVGVQPSFRSDSLVSFVSRDRSPFSRATDHASRYGVRFRPYAMPPQQPRPSSTT